MDATLKLLTKIRNTTNAASITRCLKWVPLVMTNWKSLANWSSQATKPLLIRSWNNYVQINLPKLKSKLKRTSWRRCDRFRQELTLVSTPRIDEWKSLRVIQFRECWMTPPRAVLQAKWVGHQLKGVWALREAQLYQCLAPRLLWRVLSRHPNRTKIWHSEA